MGFLITDVSGVWSIDRRDEGAKPVSCGLLSPCQPCTARGVMAFCCTQTRECVCMRKRDQAVISRMPCVPGVNAMCLSPCGRFLYQLSSEADCVHTRAVSTGELLFAAPAGVFPRMMQQERDRLLVSGGAVGEAYLFSLPHLFLQRVIHTRHPCFAAGSWKDGYALVCAEEGEDIHTVICTLPERAVRPKKLLELSGLPAAMRVCPDQEHALLSTSDGLMKIHLKTGNVLWNRPEWALSMSIEIRGEHALISDTISGRVCLMNHDRPWESEILFSGRDAQACFLDS